MPNQGGWETDNFFEGDVSCSCFGIYSDGSAAESFSALLQLLLTGNCHWTDLAVFSLLCIPLDAVNERMPWTFPLWLQAVLGGIVLIVSQLAAGLVFNVWLGLGLWDYTPLFGNFLGQICLRYALLWLLLAGPLLILFDMIGFRSGGPWPHYKLI